MTSVFVHISAVERGRTYPQVEVQLDGGATQGLVLLGESDGDYGLSGFIALDRPAEVETPPDDVAWSYDLILGG